MVTGVKTHILFSREITTLRNRERKEESVHQPHLQLRRPPASPPPPAITTTSGSASGDQPVAKIDSPPTTTDFKTTAKNYPSYMEQLMWPNMMSHNMRPNMAQGGSVVPAQGGSVIPFSPSLCPTGTGFNQFINNFPSSQSNIPIFTGTQVWGGGQSSFLGDQGQDWGGAQPGFMESQGQDRGGAQQSFTEMIFARHNGEE